MSLYQLQELASRQQKQIESTHMLIMNKEQRLNYLSSVQGSQQGPILDYDKNLNLFKEKLALQEANLRKLRLLKGQIQKQRNANSNICSEVENIKMVHKEKERELSVAFTKIDALTRQLEELQKGNTVNSYSMNGYKHAAELDKLRQELLHKSKICKQSEEEVIFKRNMLYKRQADILKIDQKISELQSRLSRKRQLNQQLCSQVPVLRSGPVDGDNDMFPGKSCLRNSMGHCTAYKVPYLKSAISNIATVEPQQRLKGNMLKYDFSQSVDFSTNKPDSKYQTLPCNTKFASRSLSSANYSAPKQVDDSSKVISRNYVANSADCDRSAMNSSSANDISLIISHKNDSKDASLEERPSPSGSSGSSDRISSSMTAYSYSDKMGLNGLSSNTHYFSGLDKGYRRDQSASDLFPSQYVPNLAVLSKGKENNSSECNKPNSVLDSFYKTKPSLPVKPIATSNEANDAVDNCRFDNNFLFTQRSLRSSSENSSLSTPSSGVYSSSEIFSQNDNLIDKNSDERHFDELNEEDNVRNQEIEERSTVSEIVNKINNWSVSKTCHDWEKNKRRPVVSANEMEQELTQDANANVPSETIYPGGRSKEMLPTNGRDSKCDKNSPDRGKLEQDLANNNATDHEQSSSLLTKLKRIKGSLKSHDQSTKIPLGRRVSFDPLALLLDASLEGELELVKKTSSEVPNPSASNDDGITALANAVCAGHFEIVKYLVEIGCDVNVQDSDGWTPLHCAASCNNLVMIKFLVKSGACIFATTFSDHETAAEKCEEDEEGFDGCSQYLYGIQDQLGSINNGLVYALYDYESQNQDELNFKVGEAIQVLRKGDDQEKEWWWSKLADQEGYIPRNLIGMYPRIKPSFK